VEIPEVDAEDVVMDNVAEVDIEVTVTVDEVVAVLVEAVVQMTPKYILIVDAVLPRHDVVIRFLTCNISSLFVLQHQWRTGTLWRHCIYVMMAGWIAGGPRA
jgi:hypothetical protein